MNKWRSHVNTVGCRIKCGGDHSSFIRNCCICEKKAWKKFPLLVFYSVTDSVNDQLPVVMLAPLVECWTGIAEVKGSNPKQAWIFSGVVFPTAKVVHIIDECYKRGIWFRCGKPKTLLFQFLPASIITFSTLLLYKVLVSPPSKALSSLAVRKQINKIKK